MKGRIVKSCGDYVLRYSSSDLEELQIVAQWIKDRYKVDFEDVV